VEDENDEHREDFCEQVIQHCKQHQKLENVFVIFLGSPSCDFVLKNMDKDVVKSSVHETEAE